jgi:hypothetical protein
MLSALRDYLPPQFGNRTIKLPLGNSADIEFDWGSLPTPFVTLAREGGFLSMGVGIGAIDGSSDIIRLTHYLPWDHDRPFSFGWRLPQWRI